MRRIADLTPVSVRIDAKDAPVIAGVARTKPRPRLARARRGTEHANWF